MTFEEVMEIIEKDRKFQDGEVKIDKCDHGIMISDGGSILFSDSESQLKSWLIHKKVIN